MQARVILAAVILALSCGCSGDKPVAGEAAYDPAAARTTLTTALDAWKSGQLDSLSKMTPPVRILDEDLAAGRQLKEYLFVKPDAAIEAFKDVEVVLTLVDRNGRSSKQTVSYQVVLSPSPAVMRSES